MDANYTSSAQKILWKSVDEAKRRRNYQIEPEHLFYSILTSSFPIIEKNLNGTEKSKLKTTIENKIQQLARGNEQTNTVPGHRFTNMLNDAQMNRNEISEIDLLSVCLKYVPVDSSNKLEKIISEMKDSKTPTLDQFALELVHEARTTTQDPVIGRVEETRSIIEILAKKKKSNPMLVGPAGVGKTAIVNGLAQLIAKDEAPGLKNYRLYEVDVGGMVANTGVRGEFEDRVRKIIKEAEETPNIILFIDEIHTVINAGSTSGALDFSNILKPSLAAGKVKIIGATTHDE